MMAVDFSSLRTVPAMPAEELQRLPTRALLARLRDLRRLQEVPAASDWSEAEHAAVAAAGLIAFKATPIWRQAFAETKAVLDGRDHVERGGKDVRRRVQQAKQQR